MNSQGTISVPFALGSPLATSVWDLGETPAATARLAYRQGGKDLFWYPLNFRYIYRLVHVYQRMSVQVLPAV